MDSGAIQMGLFDQRGLAEITHPDYPGERLVVCRNPDLASERKRKDLLQATEAKLQPILEAVAKGTLEGAAKIGLRVGRVLNQYKVGKHFMVEVTDHTLNIPRDQAKISAEAELDGIYVIRTSVSQERLTTPEVVRTYKGLKHVEHAFRTWKGRTFKCAPSTTGVQSGSRRTSCCACSPTTYAGTWSGPGHPCCSATSSLRSQMTRWLPHSPPPQRCAKRQPSNWTMAARCTASLRC
ncbi:MAG TPA: hypothetical protein VMV09_08550 [Candidatus Saccharimonadales bacterium]|nr:hypothetical protein [Candidatus Saccharimonadales bacterium]